MTNWTRGDHSLLTLQAAGYAIILQVTTKLPRESRKKSLTCREDVSKSSTSGESYRLILLRAEPTRVSHRPRTSSALLPGPMPSPAMGVINGLLV